MSTQHRTAAAPPSETRAAARARLQRARKRRAPRTVKHLLVLTACVAMWGLLASFSMRSYADYTFFQNMVRERETHRNELQEQLHAHRQKLSFMQMEKGRDQLLMERGYLKPGDRILLFPAEKQKP